VKNQKVTVIIPEHNRPEHLKRLLDYFLNFNFPIIVADSSIEKFKYLGSFEERISYYHFPKEELGKKLYNLADKISTPYVVMCANDDFLIPEAIEQLVDFLDNNNDYNSAQGMFIDFSIKNNEIIRGLRYKSTSDIDLDDTDGLKRLFRLQSNYFQYYYSVIRTEIFNRVFESINHFSTCEISNLCLLESYMSSYIAINGKHRILPIFYSVRENILNSAASFTDTIPDVIFKSKYRKQYESYLSNLAYELHSVDNISIDRAYAKIKQSVKIYVKSIHPDFYTFKGMCLFSIKVKLKGIWKHFNDKNIVLVKSERQVDYFPFDDEASVLQWDRVRGYIMKYQHIYKK